MINQGLKKTLALVAAVSLCGEPQASSLLVSVPNVITAELEVPLKKGTTAKIHIASSQDGERLHVLRLQVGGKRFSVPEQHLRSVSRPHLGSITLAVATDDPGILRLILRYGSSEESASVSYLFNKDGYLGCEDDQGNRPCKS